MSKLMLALLLSLCLISNSGCTGSTKDDTNGTEKSEDTRQPAAAIQPTINPEGDVALDGSCEQLKPLEKGETVATISTNYGDIKVRFLPDYAPKAVENFVTHAKEGYYDGVIFHRVIDGFMIQGGDPLGTGTGGESIWGEPFGVEADPEVRHIRGALCMARTPDPVSIGSQFYIVENAALDTDSGEYMQNAVNTPDAVIPKFGNIKYSEYFPADIAQAYINYGGVPALDYQYTVFGQVYEGMSVVHEIAEVEKDADDKPVSDVIINNITVEEY